MANTIRIKRRASGNPGAPTTLQNAELAYNEVDDVLYYGKGTGGAGGSATTIPAIGGPGAFMTLSTNQTITGTKNFTGATITVPTKTQGDNSTNAASTAYVDTAVGTVQSTFTVSGNTGSFTFATGSTLSIAGDNTILTTVATQPSGSNVSLALSIKDASIPNSKLANTTITLGTTSVALGSSSSTLSGLDNVGLRDTSAAFDVRIGATSGTTLTANRTLTLDVRNANRTISLAGNLSLASSFTTSGANALTLTTTNTTNVTLPTTGTLSTLDGTETFTNKTISTGSTWNGNTIAVAYGGTGTTNGSITGTGSLTFTAGGTNTNINLVPNGTGTVDVASKRITNVAEPTQSTDAATKGYVDATKTGLSVKDPVRVATTANLTVTYNNGTSGVGATLTNSGTLAALSIDGVSLSVNDRVLVKDQSSTLQNGVYVATTVGSGAVAWVLTRATDFDNSIAGEVSGGDFVFVQEGTTQADNGYVVTTDGTITIGTTGITWAQFSGAGQVIAGAGLTKTGNTLDVVGTSNRITVNADSIDIASTYVGQSSITTLGTITSGTWNGSIVGPTYGGTGVNNGSNTITLGGNVVTANSFTTSGNFALTLTTTASTNVTLPTTGTLSTLAGTETLTNKTISTGSTWNGNVVGVAYGGTGLSSYAVGDLIYASGSTTLTKLAAVATGNVLISGGVTTAPSWGKVGLTTHVSGTLAVGNGGTGITTATTNGIIYGNGTSAFGVTAAGTWDATNGVGQLLSINSSGVPTWTDIIDGGTF
jgi:hypothetical protein